jgi:hypothetical protein
MPHENDNRRERDDPLQNRGRRRGDQIRQYTETIRMDTEELRRIHGIDKALNDLGHDD